jgi:two-component system cell cycle sensor histidine kinase/response regulator CckA
MRILLVEHDDTARGAFRQSLQLLGFQVTGARDGKEALGVIQAQEGPFDLIISDLLAPNLNALDLYDALARTQEAIRMLIITGYPMPHAAASLVQRPGVSWTSRPIDLVRLHNLVLDLTR